MHKKLNYWIFIFSTLVITVDCYAQPSISGPSKVDAGSAQCYTFTPGSPSCTYGSGVCWNISGASFTNGGSCGIIAAAKVVPNIPPGGCTCSGGTSVTVTMPSVSSLSTITVGASDQCCRGANNVTVTVVPALANSITISPSSLSVNCNSGPVTLSASTPSGGDGSYSYIWQSSTDNKTWSTINNASSSSITAVALSATGTTYYHVIVSSFDYSVTSSPASFTVVAPPIVAGNITPSFQAINSNTVPASLNGTSATGGSCGNQTYVYQWQQSTDGINFANIPGATGQNYSPGALLATTYYQRKDSTNGQVTYTSKDTIKVYPPLIAGAITPANQNINYNAIPAQLSISGTSGGNGTYLYQWQSCPTSNGTYSPIASANSNSYTPPALTASIYYEVVITSNGSSVTSAPVLINVAPQLFGGTITPGNTLIPANSSPGILTANPARGGGGSNYTYQWLKSTDGIHFVPVDSAGNSQNYVPGNLNATIYYQRQATCGSQVAFTNICTITIGTISNTDMSYIRTRDITRPGVFDTATARLLTDPNDVKQTTQYFDGLGRPVQTVTRQISPLGKDLISPVVYDAYDRESTHYLPYVSASNDGNYRPNFLTEQATFNSNQFANEQFYYSQTDFESSPLNRALKSYAPGNSWAGGGRGIETKYWINTVTDDVKMWTVQDGLNLQISAADNGNGTQNVTWTWISSGLPANVSTILFLYRPQGSTGSWTTATVGSTTPTVQAIPTGNYQYAMQLQFNDGTAARMVYLDSHIASSYKISGSFPAGALYKTVTVDEQGRQMVEFKDKEGKIILKKAQLTATPDSGAGSGYIGWACTYYLYDNYSNLRCVIQPKGVDVIRSNWLLTDSSILAEQCFRYEFDGRRRMTAKKVPGAGEAWMVYDGRDRLVFTQDSIMRGQNQWLGMLYDALDRPTIRGTITWAGSRDQLQQVVTTQTAAGGGSTLTVTGSSPSTLQSNLTLSGQQLTGDYQATQSVIIGTESSTAAGGEFIGEIVTTSATGSSNTITVNSNPLPSGVTLQPLTVNFYDDYSWIAGSGTSLSSSLDSSNVRNSSYFITSYSISPTYAVLPAQYTITRGLQTGSMSMILGSSNQYLTTVNFYDDHSRAIQTQVTNVTGGKDITTHQYDFSGRGLRILQQQQKAGSNPQNHLVLSKLSYDPMGRLLTLTKTLNTTINGQTYPSSEQVIANNQYNELGQLRAKYLGGSSTAAIDSLVYEYNIRGWLTSINKQYLASGSAPPINYFGMELAYDKLISITGTGYPNVTYNGNIAGTIWKSAGDGINRKYDFTYDNMNRLTWADFRQAAGSSFDRSAGIDFSVSNLTYDANGNILTMAQNGFKIGGSSPIDQLSYTYQNGGVSNKLIQVIDGANDQNSKLGDFHYNPSTKGSSDYTYDGNGNLLVDNNKAIDQISYNYLNLPQLVHMMGKGNILYTYDATGNKLKKVTMDSTSNHSTTTLYMNGFVYQQTDSINNPGGGVDTLQFTGHEEGRARWAFHKYQNGTTAYGWEYDFFEKDHLGNTRIVLTQQKDTAQYLATMEAAYRNTENALFYNIPTTCVARTAAPGYPADLSVTNPNDSISRLNGNGPKVGPAVILKVMSGDKVDIGVNYYYNNVTVSPGQPISSNDLINALASGIVSLTGGGHGSFADLTGGASPLPGSLTSFIQGNNAVQSGKPNAYLNWVLLDNQFNFVAASSGALPVGSYGTQSGGLQSPLAKQGIPMTKSGYLYIYVSNSTPGWDVFFDNLSVKTYSGPMIEENHYYPFGLSMSGISDKALKTNYAENKYRYNKGTELQNKEFSDGSGLELYATNYRSLDPQLGRFCQIDPFADVNEDVSTYSFAGNNPILLNDPFGLLSDSSHPQERAPVTVTGHKNAPVNLIPLTFSQPKSQRDGVSIGIRAPRTDNFRIIPAAEANARLPQPAYPANSNVREFRTTTLQRFVRVSNRVAGNIRGAWLVRQESIRGMTPAEIQKNLALPAVPDQVGYVDVPVGTLMRAGPVGGNAFGEGNTKITQFQLMENIPNASFIEPINIEYLDELKWESPEIEPIKSTEPIRTEPIETPKPGIP